MTLNDIIDLNFVILPNSLCLQADYMKVIEDRPVMSAQYHLPLLAKTDPRCSSVSAIAELLIGAV